MTDEINPALMVGFQIVDMALLEVSLKDLSDAVDKAPYGFKIELNNKLDHKEALLIVTVKASLVNMESEDPIASISVGYRFTIENFASLGLEPEASLPANLASTLNGVAISTTRGVFYSETRGTNIDGKIMPIIDPTHIMRKT